MSAQLRVHGTMTVLQLKQLVKLRDGLPLHRCHLNLVEGEEGKGIPMSDEVTLGSLGLKKDTLKRVDIVLAPKVAEPPPSPSNDDSKVNFDLSKVPEDTVFEVSVGYSQKPIDDTGQLQITEVEEEEPQKDEEGDQATVMMPDMFQQKKPKTLSGQALDGYKVLDGCGVDLPEEVCRAVLTSFDPVFNDIIPEHMSEFTNLTYLDMSGNNMPLEKLSCMPALQELHLSCNALRRVLFTDPLQASFSNTLQVLDLSYNFLSVDSVKELTSIPSLTDLNLSGNDIPALPPDLSGFRVLRKLSLRRNRLGQQYQPLPIIPPSLISARQSGKFAGLNNDSILVMTLDYIFLAALATIPILEELDISENHLQAIPPGLPRGFKRLKFLNLSYNFIDDQRKTIPLVEWPAIEWLDVRGNLFNVDSVHSRASPTQEYPFLYRTLCEGRGIKIVISQPKPSYMHDEGHILRYIPEKNYRQQSAPQTRSRPRPQRIQRITDTNELAQIFGVPTNTENKEVAPMPSNLYDDDEDDTFLTSTHKPGSFEDPTKTLMKRSDDPTEQPTQGFQAAKALNSLRYILDHPLKPVKNSQESYEMLTESMEMRQRPRRNYVINKRFTDGRKGRRPKVAEVYAKMEDVLDAMDGSKGSGLQLRRNMQKEMHDKQHQITNARVRARRDAERQADDINNLLRTVSRNFDDGNSRARVSYEAKPVY